MRTVAHLRGSIAGAAILTAFGGVWCMLALAGWPARPVWSVPAACMALVALLAFAVARLLALRHLRSADDPVAAANGKRDGMWFGIIFGIEGGLIALSSVVLAHMGLDAWIVIAAAIIIGLHFLPLARLFEMPIYYGTGAAAILGMFACATIHNVDTRVLCAALTMAAVLWTTSFVVLLQARITQA